MSENTTEWLQARLSGEYRDSLPVPEQTTVGTEVKMEMNDVGKSENGKSEKGKPRSVWVEWVPGASVTEHVHAQLMRLAELETSDCVEVRAGDYRPNHQYLTAEGVPHQAPIGRLLMMRRAERVLARWEFAVHSCDNKRCCNPAHLSIGTCTRNNLETAARQRRPGMLPPKTVEWVREQAALGRGHTAIAREGRLRVHVVRGIARGLTYTDREGLTDLSQVEEMRRLQGLGHTYESLAVQFGTSPQRAHQLVTGRRSSGKPLDSAA
jgi:hypothetical protein